MLTIIHANPARVVDGELWIDRKFHSGMQAYLASVRAPIVSVHPEAAPGEAIMDMTRVPLAELGYGVLTLKVDKAQRTLPSELPKLQDQLARTELMYGGGFGGTEIARARGIPYILVLEYNLRTQVTVTMSQVPGALRRGVRALRCTAQYLRGIPSMSAAAGLHCNGYPVYDESARFNRNRVLYLDSRMSAEMVIPQAALQARLADRPAQAQRPLRLLYSGRYEAMKGALDAVRVGVECLRLGLDIEMHCYGQGSLAPQMRELAQSAGAGRIQIHDAIPYPELVERSRGFDVFVCCHIQADPSCTYLESFGAGLPIVGYDNHMWRRLQADAGAGMSSPLGDPQRVARDVERLARDASLLAQLSQRARDFAAHHTFETEFARRTDDLNRALEAARLAGTRKGTAQQA